MEITVETPNNFEIENVSEKKLKGGDFEIAAGKQN
jgi:hypothetical protein